MDRNVGLRGRSKREGRRGLRWERVKVTGRRRDIFDKDQGRGITVGTGPGNGPTLPLPGHRHSTSTRIPDRLVLGTRDS